MIYFLNIESKYANRKRRKKGIYEYIELFTVFSDVWKIALNPFLDIRKSKLNLSSNIFICRKKTKNIYTKSIFRYVVV